MFNVKCFSFWSIEGVIIKVKNTLVGSGSKFVLCSSYSKIIGNIVRY